GTRRSGGPRHDPGGQSMDRLRPDGTVTVAMPGTGHHAGPDSRAPGI
ncbi:MAG: hypothetical protein AVDCRST_MAG33-2529, partial [uncultured Thermomicrobiales bacterium]